MKNSSEQIKLGMRHHQAGDLGAAEKIYRQILDWEPNHPDALHLLGVLAGQCGKNDAALDLIGRAIRIKPDYFDAHRNLGTVLAQMGRFEEAVEVYRKVVAMRPDNADLHRDLGAVLRSSGRVEEAADSYSKAAQLDPNSPEAYRNMGKALAIQGRAEEAAAAYLRAIELKPDWMDAHFNLAELFQGERRLDEALAEYRRVMELKPDLFEAQNNIANILRDMGRWDEAVAAYLKAIELKPDNSALHRNFGQALMAADRPEEALVAFGNAIRTNPDNYEAHASMAMAMVMLQRYEEAMQFQAAAAALAPDACITHQAMGEILLHKQDLTAMEHFRRATAADPHDVSAWNKLAMALRAQGKFDEAASCYRRVMEIDPKSPVGYNGLVSTGKAASGLAEIERLTVTMNRPGLSVDERIDVGFALGKVLDDLDRYDEAFPRYAEANALAKQLRALAGERYDPAAMHRQIDEMIEAYTPSFFQERGDWGDPSEIPVFVVGMPRSGTTLVQQIAASHPQVYGAGELRDISIIANSLGGAKVKDAVLGWKPESIRKAAEQHVRRLRDMNATASRIVDKMPGNVLNVGLIAVMFPRARVVLCRRDARDNGLSCFFQLFSTGNLFSFDLAHCGENCLATARLMEHWKRVSPLKMLEVQYESVVADLEGQSRRLIDFLGLPWDPACLEFYRAKNAVLTASVWQVRQPIYTGSVGRWRHYEKYLGPLLDVLGRGEQGK